MRGDVPQARSQAGKCRALAERLDYVAYLDSADLVRGWADAVQGDLSAAARLDTCFDRYLETGLRMFEPLYLLLRAEAHSASGHLSRAHELIRQSRAVRAETGEVCSSPRLLAWAARELPEST
jgi:predicted ATPase